MTFFRQLLSNISNIGDDMPVGSVVAFAGNTPPLIGYCVMDKLCLGHSILNCSM